jgi:hypothetical protein
MAEAVSGTLSRWSLPLVVLAFSPAIHAHVVDEYLQATLVSIEPGDIRLHVNLTPGVNVAEQILSLIDHDRDDAISTDEAAAYAEALKRDLVVRLDERDVDLKAASVVVPQPAELRTGWGIIKIEFSATSGPLSAGAHRLALESRHMPAVGVHLINAAKPRSDLIRVTRQHRNENQSAGEIEFTSGAPPRASRSFGAGVAFSLVAMLVALLAAWWIRTRSIAPPLKR